VQPGWAYKGRIGTLYFMSPEVYDRHFPHHITDDVLKAADIWSLGVTIFMMVTGAEPFAESDGKVIYELAWPPDVDLSDSCKDLISSMLHLDYTKRLSAEQVLAHPWIDKCEHNAVKSLSSVVNALSDFSVSKLMKKVVIGLLNKEDKPEDVRMLQELFHELDIDGDHRLDVGELTGYMMQHGFTIRDEASMSAKELIDSTEESKSVRVFLIEHNFDFSIVNVFLCVNCHRSNRLISINFTPTTCRVDWVRKPLRFAKYSTLSIRQIVVISS
jgi:calcium-dependent protein kinase